MAVDTSSVEFEQKLIDAVRDRPSLWDKGNDNYKNVRCKERCWREVASEVFGAEIEDINIEAKRAKKLWCDTLRPQYTKYRRKLVRPSGSAGNRRPHFRHEEAMRFLIGTIEPDEVTFTNCEDLLINSNDQIQDFEEFTLGLVDSQHSPPVIAEPQNSESKGRVHAKFGGKRKLDEVDKELLSAIKKISESSEQDTESDNFGRMIAQKMKKLSVDRRIYLTTQAKVLSILNEAEISLLEK